MEIDINDFHAAAAEFRNGLMDELVKLRAYIAKLERELDKLRAAPEQKGD